MCNMMDLCIICNKFMKVTFQSAPVYNLNMYKHYQTTITEVFLEKCQH
jgi:hypothetical protein